MISTERHIFYPLNVTVCVHVYVLICGISSSNEYAHSYLDMVACPEPPQDEQLSAFQADCTRHLAGDSSHKRRGIDKPCLFGMQKVKTKGTAPCENCRALRRECIFDESLDQRRRVAAKRTAEELEYHRDMLNDLFKVIRSAGEPQAQKLMELIRNDATPEEVRLFIDEILAELQVIEPSSNDKQETAAQLKALRDSANMQGSAPSFRRKVMDVNFLCDNPPIQVPAKPWTTVSDDDAFVSHLVSLYFTWDYPFYTFLDRDVLVEHMRVGKADSDHCSPFLVNALLAQACHFSEYSEAYGDPGDVATKGQRFLHEAEKHYHQEADKLKIATVQGTLILHERYSISGQDDLGYAMLKTATELAVKMGYVDEDEEGRAEDKDLSGKSLDMAGSITKSIWGLFQVDTVCHTGFLKPNRIRHVHLQRPPRVSLQNDVEPWAPYPAQKPPRPAYFITYFDESCTLSEISRAISNMLFTDDEELDDKAHLSQTIETLYQRLRRWHDSLPDEFNPAHAPAPHILLLHIRYYTVLISMFNCLRGHNHQSKSTKVESPASEGQGTEYIAISSAREIAKLVSIHQKEYGMSRSHIFALYAVNLALFVLLERGAFQLSDPDCIALTSAFAVITTRSVLGHRVLSIFRHSIRKMQQDNRESTRWDELPEGLRKILEEEESSTYSEDSRSMSSGQGEAASDDDDDSEKLMVSPLGSQKAEPVFPRGTQQKDGGGLYEMLCRYEVMSLGRDEHTQRKGFKEGNP
ncbi:Nitrogen assimilation transcription factor nirA [Talaromyces islandicus]|uniref:Nitrogen assimilation transcription factor nirA n=1 Tax=Talaromyces islandicus TaxID=28573 RepID=A0A0U1LMZ7_TALIS|nr:Nitrogen assimilation transcription factor nirA [Talaromyces islandicus]